LAKATRLVAMRDRQATASSGCPDTPGGLGPDGLEGVQLLQLLAELGLPIGDLLEERGIDLDALCR